MIAPAAAMALGTALAPGCPALAQPVAPRAAPANDVLPAGMPPGQGRRPPVDGAPVDGAPADAAAADARVSAMIARAHDTYAAAASRRQACVAAGAPGEIVVCARTRTPDQRVPSTAQSDPASRAAQHELNAGAPRTPWVSGLPDCQVEHCMRVGRAPPPLYLIDIPKLPAPPPGSDAERIASGAARGD